MARIYTLVNQKGGVGKTTTAINLSASLASLGLRILIIDLDPQSNATSSLKIDKNKIIGGTYNVLTGNSQINDFVLHNNRLRISLLPASPALAGGEIELVSVNNRERLLKNALLSVNNNYDYIFVDCPPSLGLLTLNGIVAAKNGVLIPVQCEYLALEGLGQLMHTLNLVRRAYFPELEIRGVLMTMFDNRTNLSVDVVNEVRQYFPDKVFKTVVPRNVRIAEAPSYGLPVSVFAPSSQGALAYGALANEIIQGDGIANQAIEE
jgi:chromosome partitioning protein